MRSAQWEDYEIVERLGIGGMAEVFLARVRGAAGFQKHVVLKRALVASTDDDDLKAMFLDEARLAANLMHPNIAAIYELGTSDDGFFYVMEYVDGVDLADLIYRARLEMTPIDTAAALFICAQLAEALAYAHDATDSDGNPLGIVHRDVSPHNILLGKNGAVKLTDFGVARSNEQTTKTKTGALKGKMNYMSPEQLQGLPVDGRSDLYALGVILFEIFAQRQPYTVPGLVPRLQAMLDEKWADAIPADTSIPPPIFEVISRCLKQDPDARFPNATATHRALQGVIARGEWFTSSTALGAYVREVLARPELSYDERQAAKAAKAAKAPDDVQAPANDAQPPADDLRPPSNFSEQSDKRAAVSPPLEQPAQPVSVVPPVAGTGLPPGLLVSRMDVSVEATRTVMTPMPSAPASSSAAPNADDDPTRASAVRETSLAATAAPASPVGSRIDESGDFSSEWSGEAGPFTGESQTSAHEQVDGTLATYTSEGVFSQTTVAVQFPPSVTHSGEPFDDSRLPTLAAGPPAAIGHRVAAGADATTSAPSQTPFLSEISSFGSGDTKALIAPAALSPKGSPGVTNATVQQGAAAPPPSTTSPDKRNRVIPLLVGTVVLAVLLALAYSAWPTDDSRVAAEDGPLPQPAPATSPPDDAEEGAPHDGDKVARSNATLPRAAVPEAPLEASPEKRSPPEATPKAPADVRTADDRPTAKRTSTDRNTRSRNKRKRSSTTARSSSESASKAPAFVTLNAIPWASVKIDGVDAGITPLLNVKLAAGTHRIVFTSGDKKQTKKRRITLKPDERRRVQVRFTAP